MTQEKYVNEHLTVLNSETENYFQYNTFNPYTKGIDYSIFIDVLKSDNDTIYKVEIMSRDFRM